MAEHLEDAVPVTTVVGAEGQITVPPAMRESLNLEAGMPVAVVQIGRALMMFPEPSRFDELCDSLRILLAQSGASNVDQLRALAAMLANQQRMIANSERMLTNEIEIAARERR